MSRTYENKSAARQYDSARSLSDETLRMWMDRVRSHVPLESVDHILDLGAGTGRFSEPLHMTFNGSVTAVEPSEAMLEEGKTRALPAVTWRRGTAESIPADDGQFDLVWMSQVFHHLDNRQAAIQEVRRVIRQGGYLVIRNATRENDAEIAWFACFPEAQQLDKGRIPFRRDIVEQVCAEGFTVVATEAVYQRTAPSWTTFYDKVSQRALSVMISISDEAFEQGLQRLKRWVAEQPENTSVVEPVELMVFVAI